MATLLRTDITIHLPISDYEARVIAANRRLADLNIVRTDYRTAPDGMQRFLRALRSMEARQS
jgi:hypothetical protein